MKLVFSRFPKLFLAAFFVILMAAGCSGVSGSQSASPDSGESPVTTKGTVTGYASISADGSSIKISSSPSSPSGYSALAGAAVGVE